MVINQTNQNTDDIKLPQKKQKKSRNKRKKIAEKMRQDKQNTQTPIAGRNRSTSKRRSRSQNVRPRQNEQTQVGKEHKEKQISTSQAIKETPIDNDISSQ